MTFFRQTTALTHGWEFRAESKSAPSAVKAWNPALPLPSTIHQDLIAIKAIPDPFLAKNEEEVQWVGRQAWKYRKQFHVPNEALLDHAVKKYLVFDGLDTYARVWLNGRKILKCENMFVSHRVEVSHAINTDQTPNLLEVAFDDAERTGEEEVAQHPDHIWGTFNSGEARLATRKAQYHYGWDWGPKLMTCGLWRPVYLELSQSRISDLSAQITLSQDLHEAVLNIAVEVDGGAEHVRIDLEYERAIVASESVRVGPSGTANTTIKVKQPKLWWPHTFGEQHMYQIKATISNTASFDGVQDTVVRRIGLRHVELVQHDFADQDGTSFYFKVNHVPIFGGGSNWIPGDSFLPRISPARYRRWVAAAKESNQIMIRVWGGGIYEDEAFYNACDEMGLLVWQDFMFACGMFPAYKSFLEKAEIEVRDNVRKLRHHPCMALWCGNNEDYVIPLISNIEYDHDENDPEAILKSAFPARYTYEHLLPRLCEELVPDTPYWPGSPFGGAMCNSRTEGDIHQWHVWHMEKFPYQDFPKLSGRFVSEFGMQGMPTLRTARDFFPTNDELEDGRDYAEDEYVQYHNKCNGGAETLHKYCEDNLPLEKNSLSRYIYCTQLLQSETIATAFRSWRRLWRGEGKEFCGGALIWQLNDCYPVTSWSLIDSNLRPKMGFWAMKRENKPVTAGLQRIDHHGVTLLEAWAVNTSLDDVTVDVTIRAWHVAGGKELWRCVLYEGLVLRNNRSTELGIVDPNMVGVKSRQRYKDIVFAVDLIAVGTNKAARCDTTLDRNINFHEPLKEVPFARPSTFNAKLALHKDQIVIALSSSCALKGVLMEATASDPRADEITWDDNGFDMLPDQQVRVKVSGLQLGEEHRLNISWLGDERRTLEVPSLKALL